MSRYDVIDEALKPASKPKVYNDWQDDGLKIVDLLRSTRPEHQSAITKLYNDCPHKHSICLKTGQRIPVTAHTVAAWASNPQNNTGYVARLRRKGLL